eukprot:CAMPEP_0196204692 /NCGR_PEP_ID=MMETSP0912-20130531/6717_1 /TAXON_ID=49265 /ORGANISM="Thalassiosira rotula, Strain GSO102" /LENGTH=76 /DNA_ID=CAMNT_0041478973 /DNA_START=445 /DNA_END=675 /DNA_ORIENTATION=-
MIKEEREKTALQNDSQDAVKEEIEYPLQFDLVSYTRQVRIQCHSQAHLHKCNIEGEETSLKIIIGILREDRNAYYI